MESKKFCHPGATKGSEGSPKVPLARRCFAVAQHDSGYILIKKGIKKSDK